MGSTPARTRGWSPRPIRARAVDVVERAPHVDRDATNAAAPAADLRHQLSVGAIWTAAGLAAAAMTSFFLTVLLARVMTPADYGLLSTAIAGTGLASVVAGAGLNQAVAHVGAVQLQRNGGRGVVATAKAGLSIASWIAACVCAVVLAGVALQRVFMPGQSRLVTVVLVLAPVVATFPVAAVLNGVMLAAYRPKAYAVGNWITAGATLTIVALLLVLGQRSPEDVAAAKSVAAIAGIVFLALYYRTAVARRYNTAPAPSLQSDAVVSTGVRTLRRQLLGAAPAMVLMGAFAAATSQLDVLFVGTLRGSRAAAIYQPTSRILDLVSFLLACFAPFFLSLASRAAARGDVDAVSALQHWTSRWALALAAPIMAPLLVAPSAALHTLYGPSYTVPVDAARLLGIAGIVAPAIGFAVYALAALGLARLVGRVLAGFLLMDIVACAALVPLYGITGAAIATSGCVVASLVVSAVVLWRRFGTVPWNRAWLATAGAFVASLVVAGVAPWPHRGDLVRAVSVALIAAVFTIGAAYATGGASERRAIVDLVVQPLRRRRDRSRPA